MGHIEGNQHGLYVRARYHCRKAHPAHMLYRFYETGNFNQDISAWNTSSVTSTRSMCVESNLLLAAGAWGSHIEQVCPVPVLCSGHHAMGHAEAAEQHRNVGIPSETPVRNVQLKHNAGFMVLVGGRRSAYAAFTPSWTLALLQRGITTSTEGSSTPLPLVSARLRMETASASNTTAALSTG